MTKPTAIGTYVYAGGFSIGAEKHLDIQAHFEDGPFGGDTVRNNRPGRSIFDAPEDWPLEDYRGVDVVFANPPCAPWSPAGNRCEFGEERTGDHRALVDVLDQLEPKVWIWESVTQAYTGKHDWLSQYVTGHAMELGYTVYHFLHDIKFMGAPQQRRRVFTVCSRVELDFPTPSGKIVTLGEAIADIDDPGYHMPFDNPEYAPYIPSLPQGKTLRTWYLSQGNEPPAPGFLLTRASADKPCRTLLGGWHIFHPTEDRFLGHHEAARVCGYPDDYVFARSAGDYMHQIARAVTPFAGEYIGKVAADGVQSGVPVVEPQEWVINFMANSPRLDDYRMQEIRQRIL